MTKIPKAWSEWAEPFDRTDRMLLPNPPEGFKWTPKYETSQNAQEQRQNVITMVVEWELTPIT